jgi:hypothetical protein
MSIPSTAIIYRLVFIKMRPNPARPNSQSFAVQRFVSTKDIAQSRMS